MGGKNIKHGFKNIFKHKTYTIVGIMGLAFGFAASFFILLYVLSELGYDKCHENYKRIYRTITIKNDFSLKSPGSSLPLYPLLKEEIPEIEKVSRLRYGTVVLVKDNNYMRQRRVYGADNDIFDIFSFQFIEKAGNRLIDDKLSAVISENVRDKYFGDTSVLNNYMTCLINNQKLNLKITGVFKDFPEKSSLKPEMIINIEYPIEYLENTFSYIRTNWFDSFFNIYFLTNKTAQISEINRKLNQIARDHIDPDLNMDLSSQNMKEVYFRSTNLANDHYHKHGNISFIYIFSSLGILVFLIASVNFIILTTTVAIKRFKEIGTRKVAGASQFEIIKQFMTESFIQVFLSFVIAIILIEIFNPVLNKLFGIDILLNYSRDYRFLLLVFCISILTSVTSAFYISFFINRYRPILLLNTDMVNVKFKSRVRNILLIFQIIIFIGLLSSSTMIYKQVHYLKTKDPGFEYKNLMTVNLNPKNVSVVKDELRKRPYIENVCGIFHAPPRRGSMSSTFQSIKNPGEKVVIHGLSGDFDFPATFGFKLIDGRYFSENYSTDRSAFIINESAVKLLELKDPLNHKLEGEKIIGIIQDCNIYPLRRKIPPLYISIAEPKIIKQIGIRYSPGKQQEVIESLEEIWDKLSISGKPNYNIVENRLRNFYGKEENLVKIFNFFTILALIIAFSGIWGVSLFTCQQKTKEIGIRKINGASVSSIISQLTREYFLLTVIACLIAFPLSLWFINNWLDNFAFKTAISWWIFLIPAVISSITIILTSIWQIITTAKKNPVEAIRYE